MFVSIVYAFLRIFVIPVAGFILKLWLVKVVVDIGENLGWWVARYGKIKHKCCSEKQEWAEKKFELLTNRFAKQAK